MRAVGLLVLAALYVEFKDASISPTGHITRKPRPQRHPTQEEDTKEAMASFISRRTAIERCGYKVLYMDFREF